MTISKDSSAPLVVVMGATGNQGSSVIQALKESDRPYRIRGFTRDTGKAASKELTAEGVEMVAVEPTVENKDQVLKQFEGAQFVFELSEGKMLVDAAKEAKVDLFVWSGIHNMAKASGGKYTNVRHFDIKEEITQYLKASGQRFVNVEPASFMENYVAHSAPRKQADGTFAMYGVVSPDSVVPLINTKHDYGLFVRKAIEIPGPNEIYAHAEVISMKNIAKGIVQGTGKNVTYVQIPQEAFIGAMTARGIPKDVAISYYEMYMSVAEYGYFGSEDLGPSLVGLARAPRTWAQFVEVSDWSKILK
ncbi:hypothetical protein FRB96_004410 [Tulasnella sp. 330]|nr:hypothetical protein FRB96_004410 [Tulasnella sp. 330]